MDTPQEKIILEYTSQDALKLLLQKLTQLDSDIEARIRAAMNEGKDIQEQEKNNKKKPRIYRKTVPYTDGEALAVAVNALEAYFIQQPMFINSFHQNMVKTIIGQPRRPSYREEKEQSSFEEKIGNVEKQVVVETRTETQLRTAIQIIDSEQEIESLASVDIKELEEQRQNISHLRTLITFENK